MELGCPRMQHCPSHPPTRFGSFALPPSLCPAPQSCCHLNLERSSPGLGAAEPCRSQCWSLAAPSSSCHIPFKERLCKMFWFHFASRLLKTFLSSLFSPFVFFACSAFRRNNKFLFFFFPYPWRIIFFQKFSQDPMAWTSLQELKWVGSFSEKPSPSYDCWAMQVTSK